MDKITNYMHRYQKAFQRIYRSTNNMMKQHVHPQITTDQFTVLQYIFYKERVNSSQLAEEMGVGRSAITALVNRLVEKNMLTRERYKEDRRIVYLSLTAEGKETVIKTEEAIQLYLQDKLNHFPIEDIERFLTSIEKLATLMEDDKGAKK